MEDVGSEVKKVKPGDRVVSSFTIACGQCMLCNLQEYALCDKCAPPLQDQEQCIT